MPSPSVSSSSSELLPSGFSLGSVTLSPSLSSAPQMESPSSGVTRVKVFFSWLKV